MNPNKIDEWAEKYCPDESPKALSPGLVYDPVRWFLAGDSDLRLLEGWKYAQSGRRYSLIRGDNFSVRLREPAPQFANTPTIVVGSATVDTRQQAVYDAMEKALS